jgi:hypothetical protein
MSLSGKIEMLARDREFKKFLQEEQPEEMEMEMEAPEAEMMTEEDADAMMMDRL